MGHVNLNGATGCEHMSDLFGELNSYELFVCNVLRRLDVH